MINESQANAIIDAMFKWIYDEPITNSERQRERLSIIANIVIDAAHSDITNQPLHIAYQRAKQIRGII
jgi:hypothetical protein